MIAPVCCPVDPLVLPKFSQSKGVNPVGTVFEATGAAAAPSDASSDDDELATGVGTAAAIIINLPNFFLFNFKFKATKNIALHNR